MCSSDVAVEGRIWVRPAALVGLSATAASGSPALSRNTSPSITLAGMFVPATACSIIGANAATRVAVATAPPGLLENST